MYLTSKKKVESQAIHRDEGNRTQFTMYVTLAVQGLNTPLTYTPPHLFSNRGFDTGTYFCLPSPVMVSLYLSMKPLFRNSAYRKNIL